eukprot:1286730-Rhodomonas_salina.2
MEMLAARMGRMPRQTASCLLSIFCSVAQRFNVSQDEVAVPALCILSERLRTCPAAEEVQTPRRSDSMNGMKVSIRD